MFVSRLPKKVACKKTHRESGAHGRKVRISNAAVHRKRKHLDREKGNISIENSWRIRVFYR